MSRNHHEGVRKVCDCPRRCWSKCFHPWHFNFRWKGEDYRFSLERRIGRIARTESGKYRRDLSSLGDRIISKTDANAEADRLRAIIRSGAFDDENRLKRGSMNLADLLNLRLEQYVRGSHPEQERSCVYQMNAILRTVVSRPRGGGAPFGDWRVRDISTNTIERFREIRRVKGNGPSTTNALLIHLNSAFNWAIRNEYLDETPFRRHGLSVIKMARKIKRDRRLHPGEEQKLMDAADEYLRDLITAALETGMRIGEIRCLQWKHVRGLSLDGGTGTWEQYPEICLPAQNTKTRTARRIPISDDLKAILVRRRFDPNNVPLPTEAHVFGTAIGRRISYCAIVHRWWKTVLRAHGYVGPVWKGTTGTLQDEARAALNKIDLHFHDLRREAGSRWLEDLLPLHTVRDWLGHTSIAQTSTYLATSVQTRHDAMRQFDENRRKRRVS